jgi:very-short-patch-repair endonuclease
MLSSDLEAWWLKHPSTKARLPKELLARVDALVFPGFETVAEKTFALRHGLTTRPTCVVCGKKVSFTSKFLATCSIQCAGKNASRLEAIARTNIERYGNKFPMCNPEVRERVKATNITRYGLPFATQSQDVKGRTRATNMSLYGVPCTLNSDTNTTLKKATWLAKYGAENPGQATGPKSKTQAKLRAAKAAEKAKRIQELKGKGVSAQFDTWEGAAVNYSWKHDACGTIFSHHFRGNIIPRCPKCAPRNTSVEERAIWELLSSLGVKYTTNDRTVISPLELDVFIDTHKLAIEINGAYWHHDKGSLRPLIDKTRAAASSGVQLLHFWAHEINENMGAVSSIILAKLGLHTRQYARKLRIKQVSAADAAAFLRAHHLAGYARAKLHLALTDKTDIAAVASFSPNRFQKNGTWELVRFASEGLVVGGLSRLISEFQRRVTATLISFADARYSTGAAYKTVGFKEEGLTKPNYFYIKGSSRLHRQQAMKHKLPSFLSVFDAGLTEYENMSNNGWLRCSDCGSYKFILTHPNTIL